MKTYGEFVKYKPETGEELKRTAYSPREAVQFRFDGWERIEPMPTPRAAQATPMTTPQTPAPKPKTTPTDK